MEVIINIYTIIGLICASSIISLVIYLYHLVKGVSYSLRSYRLQSSSWLMTLNIATFFIVTYAIRLM